MSVVWFAIGLIFLHHVPGYENQQYRNREYSFFSGCPNRESVPADSCQKMAPAEWMFLFDLTNWHTPEDFRRAFEAQRQIALAMFNEMNRTLEFGPKNHQIAVLAANATFIYTIKSLCSNLPPSSIQIPTLDHFNIAYSVNGAIAALLTHAGDDVKSCGRPKNVQRILIIFCNFLVRRYTQQVYDEYGSLNSTLYKWRMDYKTAIQPWFVAVHDDSFNEVIGGTRYTNFLNELHIYPIDHPLFGNLFVNSYYEGAPVLDDIVTDLSTWLLSCACLKSDDCGTVETSRGECYFTWSNESRRQELCVADVVKVIGHRPTVPQKHRHTCADPELSETKNCASFDDCMPSCNQHQWTEWSRCTLTTRGVGQRKRQRTPSSSSRSSFTPHCKTEDLQQCTPVTAFSPTEATSTIAPHSRTEQSTPVSSFAPSESTLTIAESSLTPHSITTFHPTEATLTIVDYETTTEEPETTVVETTTTTEPTLIPIIIHKTTESIFEEPIYGLHPVVWASIASIIIFIIFALLTTIWFIMKKRHSSKRFIVIGLKSGVRKSWMGFQSPSNMGNVQRGHKKAPIGGAGYRQAAVGGKNYQPQMGGAEHRQAAVGGQNYQPPNRPQLGVGDMRRTAVKTPGKLPTQGGHYHAIQKQKKGQQKAPSRAPG